MKKITLIFFSLIILLGINTVYAHNDHDFEKTKELINSGIGCDQLTEEQLEDIGDYYMGQMHPGEEHEQMDQMMGGESPESLKQMHIRMAKVLYCGESGGMMDSADMMQMMMGSGSMIGSSSTNGIGMMGTDDVEKRSMMGTTSYKTLGIFGTLHFWLFTLIEILVVITLILLIGYLFQKITKKNKK